jgi:WD40 repeat protein
VSVAFNPDGGRQIAGACSKPGHVRLWDVRTGKEIRTFEGHRSDLSSVVFSPNGQYLASSGWDTKIKVWDVAAGRELLTIHRHSDVVARLSFSPDGKYLASGSWDGSVRLWDLTNGEEVRAFHGHSGVVHGVSFSPDGERLASAGADHQVKIWDVMTEQEGRRWQFPYAHPYGLAFSSDGNLLAAADGSSYYGPHKTVAIYDIRTGLLTRTLAGHTGRVTGVAFNPQREQGNSLLASSSTDHTVKIWDAVSGQVLHTLSGHAGVVTGVAFSLDGCRLASSSADRIVRIWDAATGKQCRELRGHTDVVTGVAFAPDDRLASASADRSVRVWGAADDTQCLVFTGHTDAVTGVAFSPDGQHVASASADQTLRIWDSAGRQEPFVLRGHTEPVTQLAYCPKGDRLVSVSQGDHTVRVWDARTGRQLLALRQTLPLSVAFSPDGQRFASGQAHYEFIKLWDAAPSQPEDPARLAAWFKHYVGQKQWDKAAAALARLDQQLPGAPGLWPDRGQCFAEQKKWSEAAAEFTEASQRNPGNLAFATWRAYALLAVGDRDGYRRACADMRQRFARPEDPHGTNNTVYTCVLSPDAVTDFDVLVQLAEKANAKRPKDWYYLDTLGAVLYRAGRCEDAIRTYDEACALHAKGGNSCNWYVMAMAHHRLGHAEEARRLLSKAVEWHRQANHADIQDPLMATPLSWGDRLGLELFRREAETLILGKDEKRNASPEETEKKADSEKTQKQRR